MLGVSLWGELPRFTMTAISMNAVVVCTIEHLMEELGSQMATASSVSSLATRC